MEGYLKSFKVEDKNLKKFILSYWVLKYNWDRDISPKLLPLTSGHIILNYGDSYRVENDEGVIDEKQDVVFFPSYKLCKIDYGKKTHIIGIELSSQGLYYLNQGNISEGIGKIKKLIDVDSELVHILRDYQEELINDKFTKLNKYFIDRFSKFYNDKDMLIVDKLLEGIEDWHIKVKEVTNESSISLRTLERKFKRNTGMTIKKYQLILRLNKVLDQIYMKEDIDWADLAIEYGFFDQPHMIKELKKYLGKTPLEYLKKRDLLGDIFVVDDAFLQ